MFSQRVREDSKNCHSIDEFVVELRSASLLCKFAGDLDMRLRDQLVLGLRVEAICKRLMKNEDASFADEIKFAGDLERVSRESRQVGSAEASVSKLTRVESQHATSTNFRILFVLFKPRAAGCLSYGRHKH